MTLFLSPRSLVLVIVVLLRQLYPEFATTVGLTMSVTS